MCGHGHLLLLLKSARLLLVADPLLDLLPHRLVLGVAGGHARPGDAGDIVRHVIF